MISSDLARTLIDAQFPEYAHLPITDVEKQGHDHCTYRLGPNMFIRIPTAASYALMSREQELLPKLEKCLSMSILAPIKMDKSSLDYPYSFSIYQWLPGKNMNLLMLTEQEQQHLVYDLAKFLKKLQAIADIKGHAGVHHHW